MNTTTSTEPTQTPQATDVHFLQDVESACQQACETIAPAWPLDRSIAVNPHWKRVQMPLRTVAARMRVLGNIQVFPPRAYMADAWADGRITRADLAHAIGQIADAKAANLTEQQCIAALSDTQGVAQLPLLIDLIDNELEHHNRLSWRQAILHQTSQTCASYFDEYQADWRPARGLSLYDYWRDTLVHDHGIGTLMGLPELGDALSALPATRNEAESWVIQRVGLPTSEWTNYLEALLHTVHGWASWCAYLNWTRRDTIQTTDHLRDLLAIRLAWGAVLLNCCDHAVTQKALLALQSQWATAPALLEAARNELLFDEVWQLALEAGHQRHVVRELDLSRQTAEVHRPKVAVQAAFCIDVRSEPLRRAVESLWPEIQTIGFAGFFGLPMAYRPMGTRHSRPQLPGLLPAAFEVTETIKAPSAIGSTTVLTSDAQVIALRQNALARTTQWLNATRWPGASLSFVETAGLGYLGKVSQWLRPSTRARDRSDLFGLSPQHRDWCRPALPDMPMADKVNLAARVLQAMGLTNELAPLVLLVGHGSQTANNAHASALDCGACCGQTGEVNARVLASLLNESAVRRDLTGLGIHIPDITCFVAALHNTTTDELEGFDLDLLPHSARERWDFAAEMFAKAGDHVRRERAIPLGLDPLLGSDKLLIQYQRRANDGASTRPELGLAGNATFIIAPRKRTAKATLNGRSFLHDYDAAHDADGAVLELLMTAPMLVTHWINWQYHASTCDPLHMGSGNKVLHNVVGGNIGVFEGNGGDLRIGLSRQSLHDGERWIHEPLRLTVIIDAPQRAIETVMRKHAVVRQLVENGWLHLWRFDQSQLLYYASGNWLPVPCEAP
jgi:uncharacterized protein YbcC (UPF0753/DUF2309 family)